MKSYMIIGLGRFGTRLAAQLYAYGEDVMAVDIDETLVNRIADHVTTAVVLDAKNKDAMKKFDVSRFDCAVVALGSDLAASVLVTMNLKSLGAKHIICKASDETHREILQKLGADQVIIPEHDVADKTAMSLARPNILEYIELSEDYGIIECNAPKFWIGKTIRELNIRAKFDVNIIAIKEEEKVKVSPTADYRITQSADLVLLGEYSALNKVRNLK